jgi:hypothetical protein
MRSSRQSRGRGNMIESRRKLFGRMLALLCAGGGIALTSNTAAFAQTRQVPRDSSSSTGGSGSGGSSSSRSSGSGSGGSSGSNSGSSRSSSGSSSSSRSSSSSSSGSGSSSSSGSGSGSSGGGSSSSRASGDSPALQQLRDMAGSAPNDGRGAPTSNRSTDGAAKR